MAKESRAPQSRTSYEKEMEMIRKEQRIQFIRIAEIQQQLDQLRSLHSRHAKVAVSLAL